MTKGFFYVATGKAFLAETLKSVRSLRKYHPDSQVTLYTEALEDVPDGLFDQVIILSDPVYSFRDKVLPIMEPPYDKNVFLDTDTLLMENVEELFELLDRVDLVYAHANNRSWGDGYEYGVPLSFPEANSGVLVYNRCEAVREMMEDWFSLYEEQIRERGVKSPDQPPLRAALYRSSLNTTVLPPEYNFRLIFPNAAGEMPVKILHGRGAPLFVAQRLVNRTGDRSRIFDFYRMSFFLRIFYKFILKQKNV